MADIRHLHPGAPGPPTEATDDDVREENRQLREENQRLRAYLNDLGKLTQRVLALRAGREKLLWVLIIVALAVYGSVPGTPLNRLLVAGWEAIQPHPPHASQPFVPPPPLVVPVADSLDPTPATAASPRPSLPTAAPPITVIVTKITPLPSSLPAHPCAVANSQPLPPRCRPAP